MCRWVVQGIVHKAAIFENMRIFTVNNESVSVYETGFVFRSLMA